MAALNGLNIEPATARQVVKYLSNNLGLAPEEAKPAAWEAERRGIDFKYTASADAESTCNKCHSLGRVISQRRTKGEWDLLIAMHRGWYPLVDNQAFRRTGPATPSGVRGRTSAGHSPPGREGRRSPLETFPLKTPEWTAWSANMRPARLDGTWALSGWELGKGAIYGRVTITADPGIAGRVHDDGHLSRGANRRHLHAHGPRDRLHRVPVARAIDDGRPPTRRCAK